MLLVQHEGLSQITASIAEMLLPHSSPRGTRVRNGSQDDSLPLQRPEDLPWKGYPLHPRGWTAVPLPEPEVQVHVPPAPAASQAGLDHPVPQGTQEGPGKWA